MSAIEQYNVYKAKSALDPSENLDLECSVKLSWELGQGLLPALLTYLSYFADLISSVSLSPCPYRVTTFVKLLFLLDLHLMSI